MKQELYRETVRLVDSRIRALLRELEIVTSKPIVIREPLHAPLVVDSALLVKRLNAEFLGGQSLQQILRKIQTAAGVNSLGEYLDPTTLIGHVKLKEGTNVTITRDDANNALEIAAAAASGAPSTLSYVTKLYETAQLPNSIQHHLLSGAYLHDPKVHKASHAAGGSDSFVDQVIRMARVEIDLNTVYIDKDASDNMTFTDPVTGTKTLAQLAAGGAGWENVVCYPWAGTAVLSDDPFLSYTTEVSDATGVYVEAAWFDFDMPAGTIKSIYAHLVWAQKVTGAGTGQVKWQIASGSHASPGTYMDITDEVSVEATSYVDRSRSGVVHKITGLTTTTPFTIRCLVKKGTATSAEAKVKSNTYLRMTYKVS